jgi:hypothetical protein
MNCIDKVEVSKEGANEVTLKLFLKLDNSEGSKEINNNTSDSVTKATWKK